MLDVSPGRALLNALPKGCRMILVADPHIGAALLATACSATACLAVLAARRVLSAQLNVCMSQKSRCAAS